jgi:hypothetical protein
LWPFTRAVCRLIGATDTGPVPEGDRIGAAQAIALGAADAAVDDFLRGAQPTPDEAAVAVAGFVPAFAFRVDPIEPDERQARVLRAAGGDCELIRALVGHQRRAHPPAPKTAAAAATITITTMERLRAGADPELLPALLAGISEAQRRELYADVESDAVLAIAVHERSVERVAERIAARRRSPEVLASVVEAFHGRTEEIARRMIEVGADAARVAEFLAFARFGEVIEGEDAALALLPPLLADLEPPDRIVAAVLARNETWKREYANCLIARQPAFFESNEAAFALFH